MALVAAHSSFHIGRRFSNLRVRLLLLKQDKLSLLEMRLDEIDRSETALLRLGSCRSDDNSERQSVLSKIDSALADYGSCFLGTHPWTPFKLMNSLDALIERNHRVLNFEAANARDVSSLQNWVDGNACLARQETAYLTHHDDLLSTASPKDQSVTRFEAWVEDALIWSSRWFRRQVSVTGMGRVSMVTHR